MTYAEFLVFFIGIPLFFLTVFFVKSEENTKLFNLKGILFLCFLAFCYTTPWDNYLVAQKVWWYGEDRVLGVIGYVPYEEYCFFILQTIMTGLWCFLIQTKFVLEKPLNHKSVIVPSVIFLMALIIFLSFLGLNHGQYFYMSLILFWATPILLLQFAIGARYMLTNLKVFTLSFLPPTLYLWVADYYAISNGIWDISKSYTVGLNLGVLPIEEMIFFMVTNLMVCQGLLLFNLMKEDLKNYIWKRPAYV